MKTEELLSYLKESLFIYDPDTGTSIYDDPEYVAMKDSHLENVLRVVMSRVNPNKTIETMSQEDIYPTVLLAKKEVYHVLATKSAPLYDLGIAGTAGSSTVSRDQRFQHYYSLIEIVNAEYKTYLSTGIPLQSAETLLDSRYFSQRNYRLAQKPTINLVIDNIYPKEIEISWNGVQVNRFKDYKIYLGNMPTVDVYENEIVKEDAKLVKILTDYHKRHFRVKDLEPLTDYHVAIIIEELNGLKGFSEMKFKTLE